MNRCFIIKVFNFIDLKFKKYFYVILLFYLFFSVYEFCNKKRGKNIYEF